MWLVELAGLENSGLLAQTVAEALEIRDHSSRPPLDILTDHLRDKRILVILDNCEHLLPQCAVLADSLLHSSPGLKILATSRHVLGLHYEHTLAVPTLDLPSTEKPRLSTKSLARCDAVRLFIERAGAVLPGFSVTEANREAVERICRQLDGIPWESSSPSSGCGRFPYSSCWSGWTTGSSCSPPVPVRCSRATRRCGR